MERFTESIEPIVERDYPYPAHVEPNPVNQDNIAITASDDSTAMLPDISCLKSPELLSSNFNGCAVFNNYLFHQDPRTGHLSLVPVQVRAPQSLPGLDINLSLVPQPFQGLIPVPDNPNMNGLNVPVKPKPQDYVTPLSCFKGSSIISNNALRALDIGQKHPATQGDNQSTSDPISPNVHPALKEVINLLKGQFSLDGYFDNSHEDVAMGMYL